MPDFVLDGGLDDRGILQSFKRIEAAGEQAGQKVGAALDKATAKKLEIKADPRSIVAMRERLEELQRRLERVNTGGTAFKQLSAQARAAEASLSRATAAAQGLSQASSGIGSSLVGQLAGLASITGVVALFKSAVDRAVELETITRKLSNTLGPQGAAGALSFTKGLADQLGLSYTTLASTFGGFTAAASAANVPIETQRGLFAAVAKSAQALGLSNDELRGSLLALQQIASKGTVSMEELRGQLGERLPIAFGAAAKGLGVTQQQLIKLVESGRLTAGEFFPALTRGLSDLTAASGGAATAAQNFERLGTAWTELQASFGTNALPGIVEGVKVLTAALEGIGVAQQAAEIGVGAFGVVSTQGAQLVGALRQVQTQFGLTGKEGVEVFARAAREVGATKDGLGQLILTNEQYEKILARLPELARKFRDANPDASAQRLAEAAAAAKVGEKLQRALDIDKARKSAAVELNNLRMQEPVRALDNQLAVGQQVQSFGAAAAELEQTRFDIIRARTQFEIDNAQKLGLTQQQVAQREIQQAGLQQQALAARYQGLLQNQRVEALMLQLTQRRAAVEAQISLITAQQAAAKARQVAADLQASNAPAAQVGAAIQAAAEAEKQVRFAQERLTLLSATQPIEARIAQANAEIARNQLLAQGAQLGIEAQLRSMTPQVEANAKSWGDVGKAAGALPGNVGTATKETGKLKEEVEKVSAGFIQVGNTVKKFTTDGLQQETSKAAGEVDNLASGFIKVGDKVKVFENGQFRDAVGDAATEAAKFESSMSASATSAMNLVGYLQATSGLAPSRFTGGPVQAGTQYRINDGPGGRSLGQEAFLSSRGDLSLINRPYSSMWTAPSSGIVLPAVLTDQLKQRGAFDTGSRGAGRVAAAVAAGTRPGGQANTARLELAVTALTAKVDALTKKNWTVQQRVTNSPGSTQVRLLSSML